MKNVLSPISEKKIRRNPDTKPSLKGESPTRPVGKKCRIKWCTQMKLANGPGLNLLDTRGLRSSAHLE